MSIPATPRLKKVIALAMKEAQGMQHNYVGVDHLLLGVLREGESRFALLMSRSGIDLDSARKMVRSLESNEGAEIASIKETALAKLTDEEKCVLLGSTFLFPRPEPNTQSTP